MLEIVQGRSRDLRVDEMIWPAQLPGALAPEAIVEEDSEGPSDLEESALKVTSKVTSSHLLEDCDLSGLPSNWCMVSINVTEDHTTMFITRRQRDRPPVIFTLPLDRQGKREEEDECFTLDTALGELREIIRESDASARDAKGIDRTDKSAKMKWWATRKALDKRLEELLKNVEFCWLGAFKVSGNFWDDLQSSDWLTSTELTRCADNLQSREWQITQVVGNVPKDAGRHLCKGFISRRQVKEHSHQARR